MSTNREDQVEFECTNELCDDMPTWWVNGRWNADGDFEPNETDDMACPECGERGDPENIDIEVVA